MIDYLSVTVAAVAVYILGFIWYAKPVFGERWMKLAGLKKMEPNAAGMFWHFVATYVLVIVLDMFVGALAMRNALITSALIWVGFFASTSLGGWLWEKKPFALWVLNNAFNLVMLMLATAILVWL